MTALNDMVDKAAPGDHLVFTFSSHGTQVPSAPGDADEPDGLDEAFACHDIKSNGDSWDRKTVIIDNELRDLFAKVPDGVLVEVLLDTCHSGTGPEGPRRHPAGDADGTPAPVPAPADAQGPEPRPRHPRRDAPRRRAQAAGRADQGARGAPRSRCCSPPAAPTRPRPTPPSTTARTAPSPTCSSRRSPRTAPAPAASCASTVTKGLKSGDFDQRSTLEAPAKAKKVPFGQPF